MPNLLLHGKGKVPQGHWKVVPWQNLMLCQSVSVKYHRPMQIIEMIEHDDIWDCPSLGVEFDNRLDKSCRQPGLPWSEAKHKTTITFWQSGLDAMQASGNRNYSQVKIPEKKLHQWQQVGILSLNAAPSSLSAKRLQDPAKQLLKQIAFSTSLSKAKKPSKKLAGHGPTCR